MLVTNKSLHICDIASNHKLYINYVGFIEPELYTYLYIISKCSKAYMFYLIARDYNASDSNATFKLNSIKRF